MTPHASSASPPEPLHLACLCAAWCRLCDGYRPVFDAVVQTLHQRWPALQPHWIDIEDDATLVGDLDIETFPTLVLVRGRQLLFAGVLTPQPEVLLRVLQAALDGGTPAAGTDPAFQAFAQRLLAQAPAR